MKLRAIALGAVAAAAVAICVAQPGIVERWNIYASSTGAPSDPYTKFLGPFPTRYSCDVEARIIVRSGGHAYCGRELALQVDRREQALLMAEFWPTARWIALCKARFRRAVVHRPPVVSGGPHAS